MSREVFSPKEISDMAAMLLKIGLHPSVVRHRLAEKGIHWSYKHQGQGMRERLRRLHAQGLGLCTLCRSNSFPLEQGVNVCQSCLEKKWQEGSIDVPSIGEVR